nr:auxilin-like protein [Tanacetum cinerariifolium]
MNFLTDPSDERFTLIPADVLVFGWVRRKHACVDLIGISPLVGLSVKGFTVGHATLKDASCKMIKHEKACNENQHVFIPFAFDTFGFLAPKAVELLNRFKRALATQLVARLHFTAIANSSTGVTQQLNSGNHFALTVATP